MYQSFDRDYYFRMTGLAPAQIPETLILHGVLNIGKYVARWRASFDQVIDTPFSEMFIGVRGGRRCAVGVVYGGPGAATALHIFANLGVKRVVLMGSCGGLDPAVPVGRFVLLDQVCHEDGTVRHYQPASQRTDATPALTERLGAALAARGAELCHGVGVSTDSIFAETAADVARWSAMGCRTIDMEASTTFAAAAHFGLERACALFVLDPLGAGRDVSALTEAERAAVGRARGALMEAATATALA